MASVVSAYRMMTGEADLFTHLESIAMQIYQMQQSKLRSMPKKFYSGADLKEQAHDTNPTCTPYDSMKIESTRKTDTVSWNIFEHHGTNELEWT